MSDLFEFLDGLGWSDAEFEAVIGDLSTRTYTRLKRIDKGSAVLMVSPVDHSLEAFVRMTRWLRGIALSAPDVIGMDMDRGWLLLEDLGEALFSSLIRAGPSDQLMLYEKAVDVLLHIRKQPVLDISEPSALKLVEATNITLEWYPNADRASYVAIQSRLAELLDPLLSAPSTVSLRDFHSDNMILMPERLGKRQVGLLDYQDAFLTHPAYDLMSLLTDARTNVPASVVENTLRSYAEKSGDSFDDLLKASAILGVQRNLRILGVFFRAARRDQKAHRLSAVPRVRKYLERCLEHPVFADVKSHLTRAVPEPPIP